MASGSTSTESTASKAIKISVLVAVLLATGVVLYMQWGKSGQLDTASSATLYVCPTDGATLSVTPADFEKMLRSGDAGPEEGATGRARGLYLRCPTCKKRVMVEGVRCEKDKTVFRRYGADGDPAACPKCGWKPAS